MERGHTQHLDHSLLALSKGSKQGIKTLSKLARKWLNIRWMIKRSVSKCSLEVIFKVEQNIYPFLARSWHRSNKYLFNDHKYWLLFITVFWELIRKDEKSLVPWSLTLMFRAASGAARTVLPKTAILKVKTHPANSFTPGNCPMINEMLPHLTYMVATKKRGNMK